MVSLKMVPEWRRSQYPTIGTARTDVLEGIHGPSRQILGMGALTPHTTNGIM